jgi:hypothetical protein
VPLCEAKLLEELDHDAIINWAIELKNGVEAYFFLMRTVGTNALNVRQTLNGLHALFKIRSHGDSNDVLQKYVGLFGQPSANAGTNRTHLAAGPVFIRSDNR